MTIAFYAPLKAPTHPVPSGDRQMARALMAALDHAGFDVELASELRLYDGQGDKAAQDQLADAAAQVVSGILAKAPQWRVWVTYHNYYKAPDLIGPPISAALGIPYLQIESTRAKKRLEGPWASFAAAAEQASDRAHTIFYFTERDAQTLRRDAPDGQHLVHLAPFLNRLDLPEPSDLSGPMLSVAMMRHGDKTASYQLIAEALAQVPSGTEWALDIAGDGPNGDAIRALFAPFGHRIRWLGACEPQEVARLYAKARAFVWPGVNEAFGMVYLEAQAAGVPVIAQARPGMREILAQTQSPPEDGAKALAARIAHICANKAAAQQAAEIGRAVVADRHLLARAAQTLQQAFEGAL